MIDRNEVRARLDAVVAAMRSNGVWDVERPADDAFVDMGAFGTRTMAFEQWLRWVFVPNVEALIASDGPWPDGSSVAAQAAREHGWGGGDAVGALVEPLAQFDRLFTPPEPPATDSPPPREDQNALGWRLLSKPDRAAADLDAAIVHFRAALAEDPDALAPFANLCDALVAAGRAADAVAEAERAGTAAAHNWLGWRTLGDPATLPRAIEHFREAIRLRPWWGLAHLNLGRALENADRDDEWYEAFATALRCDGDFDRAYCHERMATYQARRGWLRNALTSTRAALRADDQRGGGERRALHVEAETWLVQQLRADGVEPPPPGGEENDAWRRACELELPPGFMARNEMGEPFADDVVEVERLVRAGRWREVAQQLARLAARDMDELFDAVGYAARGADLAYRAGHREEAIAIQQRVVDAYRWYASGASSGGEGMARTLAVDEEAAKLRAWQRR